MSLINQMLKDLARRSKPLPDPDKVLTGLVVTNATKYSTNKIDSRLIACGAFLCLILFLAAIKHFMVSTPHQYFNVSQIDVFPAQKNNLPPLATSESSVNTAAVTGITFQVDKDITSFRFFLNQKILYRVNSYDNDRLVLVLENARLISTVPQIDTNNSAVKMMHIINQADGSLKIIFKLNAGAELNHLDLIEKSNFPELQLDLSRKLAVPENKVDVMVRQFSSPIKTLSRFTSMEEEYRAIMHFVGQNHIYEAQNGLTQFLIKYPQFVPARKALATLFLNQGETYRAKQIIDVGLQQLPLYPPYMQIKAQILVAEGKVQQALELLQTASPLFEENSEYYAFIAALYQRQNQPMLAEKLYERLVNLQPNNSIWWMGLGIARDSLNKNSAALEAFKKSDSDMLSPELKVYVETRIHALLDTR